MLFVCIGLFLIATLICGFANNAFWLAAGRAVQGMVEAILMPCSLGLISTIFSEKERGVAIGVWSSFVGIGMIIGSGLGGFIISSLGWRWAFFAKLPLLAIALLIVILVVPESRSKIMRRPFDWFGFLTISAVIACLIIPIIQITEWGWTSTLTLSFCAMAIIAAVLFYITEKKAKNPLVLLSLFSNRLFLACAAIQFVSVFFTSTAMFLTPLYLQNIHNIPVTAMGLLFMIIPLSMLIFSLIGGFTVGKLKTKKSIIIGLLPLVLSALLQMFFAPNTTIFLIVIAFIFLGMSWGWILSSTATAALNTVPADFASVSIGILWTIQNAGGAIGLAITGALFRYQDRVSLMHYLSAAHINLSQPQRELVRSLLSEPEHAKQILSQFGIAGAERILPLFTKAFLYGYASAMLLLLLLSLGCYLFTAFLIEEKA